MASSGAGRSCAGCLTGDRASRRWRMSWAMRRSRVWPRPLRRPLPASFRPAFARWSSSAGGRSCSTDGARPSICRRWGRRLGSSSLRGSTSGRSANRCGYWVASPDMSAWPPCVTPRRRIRGGAARSCRWRRSRVLQRGRPARARCPEKLETMPQQPASTQPRRRSQGRRGRARCAEKPGRGQPRRIGRRRSGMARCSAKPGSRQPRRGSPRRCGMARCPAKAGSRQPRRRQRRSWRARCPAKSGSRQPRRKSRGWSRRTRCPKQPGSRQPRRKGKEGTGVVAVGADGVTRTGRGRGAPCQPSKTARRIVTDSDAFSSARTNCPPPAWATRCMNAAVSG